MEMDFSLSSLCISVVCPFILFLIFGASIDYVARMTAMIRRIIRWARDSFNLSLVGCSPSLFIFRVVFCLPERILAQWLPVQRGFRHCFVRQGNADYKAMPSNRLAICLLWLPASYWFSRTLPLYCCASFHIPFPLPLWVDKSVSKASFASGHYRQNGWIIHGQVTWSAVSLARTPIAGMHSFVNQRVKWLDSRLAGVWLPA